MSRAFNKTALRLGFVAAALLLFLAGRWSAGGLSVPWPQAVPQAGHSQPGQVSGPSVESLYRARQSNTWVYIDGKVDRTLKDDRRGSRHQRFIVELPSGHTVLVAHNIDLAPRVPLRVGDRVELYGEYEWNDRGGVVHWTHHDPQGRRSGGWIRHANRDYR